MAGYINFPSNFYRLKPETNLSRCLFVNWRLKYLHTQPAYPSVLTGTAVACFVRFLLGHLQQTLFQGH